MRVIVSKITVLLATTTVVVLFGVGIAEAYLRVSRDTSIFADIKLLFIIILSIALVLSILLTIFFTSRSAHALIRMKIHESKLSESNSRFQWLYRNSPVPYVTIDKHARITLANLAAIRLFKRSEEELQTLNIVDLLYSDDSSSFSVILGSLKAGATIGEAEIEVVLPDESRKWVLFSVFSYGTSGERLVSLIDVTKQKQIDAAKTEFVSLASHQLHTPLASIRWNLELLGAAHAGSLSEKQRIYYDKLTQNVASMNELIDDFLNVSKLELGTFATDITTINLADFCDGVIDEFQEKIQTKQLSINRQYQSHEFSLQTDQRLFHIIVSNLMSNAVKYTPKDGSVLLSFSSDGQYITIVVQDTGLGIPASEIDNLFSKFFRATNARKLETEGTGLGLYIVKQSVEILGGTITVDSAENSGTRFEVTLPV